MASKWQSERGCGNHVLCSLPIAMGYKENKTYHGGKKGGVAKIYRGKSDIK